MSIVRYTWVHMDFESAPSPHQEKDEALKQLRQLLGEVMQMGRNDSEHSELEGIISALERSELDPQEALAKAWSLREQKQDYN